MIFGRKHVLMNVCPRVTREEVWKRAGAVRSPQNPKRQDFAIELAYDAHKEVVWLDPGAISDPLEPKVAEAMAKQYAGQGVILFNEANDVTEQKLAGLEAAIAFYNERGDASMLPFEVSLDEKQRKLMSRDLEPFRINQAREAILREYAELLVMERDTNPNAAVA